MIQDEHQRLEMCAMFFNLGLTDGWLENGKNFDALVSFLRTESSPRLVDLRDRLTEALVAAGKEKINDHGRLKALWLHGVTVLPPTAEDFKDWLAEMDAAIESQTRVAAIRQGYGGRSS